MKESFHDGELHCSDKDALPHASLYIALEEILAATISHEIDEQ